jgi:hypothetical protein
MHYNEQASAIAQSTSPTRQALFMHMKAMLAIVEAHTFYI